VVRVESKATTDLERIVEFDLVRATEQAALNSSRWMSNGDKNVADHAASAIRLRSKQGEQVL
jgi:fructose-1,6-bisphosphatase II